MPSPLGHSLMGYALYETLPQENKSLPWRMLLLYAIVANLPDIDFLPGFLLGNPNKYHHSYFSHSLGFSIFIGGLLALYFSLKKSKNFFVYFLIFTSVCFSHVVLDFITLDTSMPKGVPMFWPLSSHYFYSPVSIFMSIHKLGSSKLFIQSLFVMQNIGVALWELIVFIPVLVIIKMAKKRKRH